VRTSSYFAVWALLLLFPCLVKAAPDLRTLRNNHFEVIGLHPRSVSFVNELSQYSIQIAERYLDREQLSFPQRILISLRPEEHAHFEGPYQIRLAARGSVQLDLRWETSMTLQQTCAAISEALLTQYVVYNYGPSALDSLRAWPVAALGYDVYLSLRPAEFANLLSHSRMQQVPPLVQVLQDLQGSSQSPRNKSASYGYWLLLAMKSSALPRGVLRSLFQQALAGKDIEEALTEVIQPSEPTAAALSSQNWWIEHLNAMFQREYEAVESMEVSQAWLRALVDFGQPLKLESGEVKLDLRSLWTYRDRPELREQLQARYEILRLRMVRVNPAYYNTARSLGALFENLLNDVPSHKYLHSMVIYLSDWEDSKEMQETIENKLNF
jgi:hypothetical protein